MPLSFSQIQDAAAELGLEPCMVQAVVDIESRGEGFFPDGRVVVRFEKHVFLRELGKRGVTAQQTADARNLSGVTWPTLEKAIAIDEEAALLSASWGLFQIMGFNHKACGFPTVTEFVEAQKRNEKDHLAAFCAYMRSQGHIPFLQRYDWSGFAKRYNGPGYAKNQYDRKLKQAYDCCKAVRG